MATNTILMRDVYKSFGEVHAVNGVSIEVREGEMMGFLGPNGAGKTTTINMLTGLMRPDRGSIVIGGFDCVARPRSAQHLMGIVPDDSNLYPELTGYDNLCFCGALYGMKKKERETRSRELLETFNLTPASNRKFGGYSKGMKRRLTIAAAIMHRPRILFLDEPTTGIDVASARQVRAMINDLHREGLTIFLTTHYIEEAERLCDRIAFVVNSEIRKTDTLEALMRAHTDRFIVRITCENTPKNPLPDMQKAFPNLLLSYPEPTTLMVEDSQPTRLGPLIRYLEEMGVAVTEARRTKPSLEDIFVRITGVEAGTLRSEKEGKGGGK